MKKFFANIWTKRAVSLISVFYAFIACRVCYFSLFYDIHINSRASLCLALTGVSVLSIVAMLYSRRQILTRIASFIILPAMLPVVLLYFGEWGLIIPIIATGIVILLLSGAGEGVKTAVGTIILLLYIFGALGYFIFSSFFITTVKESVVSSGVSPSGRYRYRIVNTEDTSGGSTAVYVEPNYADKKYKFVTFTLKNMEHVVSRTRPVSEANDVQWKTQSRQEITQELEALSDAIKVDVTDDELKKLGLTFDSTLEVSDIEIYTRLDLGYTASDVDPIKLDELDADKLAKLGIGKEGTRYYVLSPSAELYDELDIASGKRVYFSDFTDDAYEIFESAHADDYGNPDFKIGSDMTVLLNTLSDEQLKMLGVSDNGDVMVYNGKVVFRYYVAEIEDYYDVDSRKLDISLLD